MVYHRWPGIIPADWKAERRSILLNDLALVALLAFAHYTVGLASFFLVQLAVGIMTAIAGVWFFCVHHLNSRIPNYKLERCMNENPVLQTPARLTLWKSFNCVSLTLWDEDKQKLVSFKAAAV